MNYRQIFKNKKIIAPISVILFIIVVVVTILVYKNNQKIPNRKTTDWDPATQTEITVFTGYTPPAGEQTIFVGFEKFQRGTDFEVYKQFTQTIKKLEKIRKVDEFQRVSLYKNSPKTTRQDGNWVTTFKIALNKDQGDLFVKINKKSYYNYEILLYEDENFTKKILNHQYCDPKVCDSEVTVH